MQVHRSITDLPEIPNAVVTIGSFDGVHKGHRKIIDALCREARKAGGQSVLISFHPHPRKVVRPDQPLELINTLEERIELLSETGIDHLVIVPFTPEFGNLEADAYIDQFLIRLFRPCTIIIGYDHRFGKGRKGDFAMLAEKSGTYHYELVEIPKYLLNEVSVSSTAIRHALLHQEVEKANELLGYDFFFSGLVVTGDQLGRTLGFPTANLDINDPDKIRLADGLYTATTIIDAEMYQGLLSIGTRPTLKNDAYKTELYLMDFQGDLYGRQLEVQVHHFLRGQQKFDNLDALIGQMKQDELRARELFG